MIGFSGDAITCWLDGDNGLRAVACALSMQEEMLLYSSIPTAMGRIVSLGLKTAVSTGDVRRFLVGNPEIKIFDVLCGETLDRLAEAEHLARKGEVVLDSKTASELQRFLKFTGWREDADSKQIAIVQSINTKIPEKPWTDTFSNRLNDGQVRPWILKPVYDRLSNGKGEFLAELRPAVALFVRFSGINFQTDPESPAYLDRYIRGVQEILNDFEGTLIQLTVGDKGSYFYTAFGAPFAHEDDPYRAVKAAVEIRTFSQGMEPEFKVQIGIAQGFMRVGAYGGAESRTYGVLGDAVNLAARLMVSAGDGQILVTELIRENTSENVDWSELSAISVKGKKGPVKIFQFDHIAVSKDGMLKINTRVPMTGRENELLQISKIIQKVRKGKGQIVGITGDAGIGKSVLARETIYKESLNHWTVFSGECQSLGMNASYLVWHSIWTKFFGLSQGASIDTQIKILEDYLYKIDPLFVQRVPLLSAVLNLAIPDNELTLSLEPKIRKASLEALMVDCVLERARREPLLFVIEDMHWIDPLSYDLLEVICRSIKNIPVLVVIIYRPTFVERLQTPRLSKMENFIEIRLNSMSPEEIKKIIVDKLALDSGGDTKISEAIIQQLIGKVEGNPFYAGQIIKYLLEFGLDIQDFQSFQSVQLPSSLQSLVLSRIDQLSENQKITLKIASVIGRVFKAAILWGVLSDDNIDSHQLQEDLIELTRFEFGVNQEEEDLAYFFRHIITHEVAYESLPFATRAILHEQIAKFIETNFPDSHQKFIDLLVFHYGKSENLSKKIEYLEKAGDIAKSNYANNAAIEYYQSLIPLLDSEDRIKISLKLCQVLEVVGQWDEAVNRYLESYQLAINFNFPLAAARCQAGLGELYRKRGNYKRALNTLTLARDLFEELGDVYGIGQTMQSLGSLATQQGDIIQAKSFYKKSLDCWQKLRLQQRVASVYSNLGIISRLTGEFKEAKELHEKGLAIRQKLSDRWAIGVSMNNLGNVALDLGHLNEARRYLEEAVALQREVGDKYYIANALNNLANVIRDQGDFPYAFQLYQESLKLNSILGDRWAMAYLFEDMAYLACLTGKYSQALLLIGAATELREAINAPLSKNEMKKMGENLIPLKKNLSLEQQQEFLYKGRLLNLEEAIEQAINIF